MATKNLLLTFKYKSDGQVKFKEPEVADPLLTDMVYKQKYKYWSEYRPTPEERKNEKWLPYKYNPHVLISNYGGIWAPNTPRGVYPSHRARDGYIRFGIVRAEAKYNRKWDSRTYCMNLPKEVCRMFVPLPEGRSLGSRMFRDGDRKNPRAENMTYYTGKRNTKTKNPFASYQSVVNMVEKRKELVADLRSRGIDPWDGW